MLQIKLLPVLSSQVRHHLYEHVHLWIHFLALQTCSLKTICGDVHTCVALDLYS